MHKIYLLLFVFLWSNNINAQQGSPSFARQIKIAAADSLLPVKEAVKTQLNKIISNKKQNNALRLLLSSTDKTAGSNTSRWLAAKKQQDIYRIDLAALISKYTGETEKNLEQVFARAARNNCILFFDEADALFGKRSSETETNPAAVFTKYCSTFKGSILINCTGDDCITKLASQNFIKIATQ